MPSPPLKIALIEPDPACAAELGQMLSDTLREFSVELADPLAADLILIDQAVPQSTQSASPIIVFARSENGNYRAQTLCGLSTSGPHAITLNMPLTDSIRYAALLRNPDPTPEVQSQRLHQRLLQAQKMEAVGELAGGIAHDFNNLLLVIRSYAEMLLEDSGLPSTGRHYAREILAASHRAADLTRELLAFSRRESPLHQPTNLNGIIDNAVPMLSRLVGKSILVWVKLPPDLWPIQANTEQLEQLLLNLAANARDAMPRGGKLLFETSNTRIDGNQNAMPPGEYVLLAVSDTGTGIPKHILPRIFEPFFTTKRRGKGTGLGLASVYGIVKQSGGHIWAYSESGYGTTFKIYMPRAANAKLSPQEPEPQLATRAAAAGSS